MYKDARKNVLTAVTLFSSNNSLVGAAVPSVIMRIRSQQNESWEEMGRIYSVTKHNSIA